MAKSCAAGAIAEVLESVIALFEFEGLLSPIVNAALDGQGQSGKLGKKKKSKSKKRPASAAMVQAQH